MKNLLFVLHLLVAFFFLPGTVNAAITIDSVQTTKSTCANNGGMVIYAKTTIGTLLYTITTGPVTYPIQTSNSFSSLPPGTYTIEVSNTSSEKEVAVVIIDGNYQLPDFVPIAVHPHCQGESSGSIIGNASLTAGLPPYTWELISPSAEIRPAQANDTFYNLPAGSYTIRMTDPCNNVQIKPLVLFAAAVPMTYIGAFVKITGCDTSEIGLSVLTPAFRPPYKVSYTVAGIPYTVDTARLDDETVFNGYLNIYFTVPNLAYGGVVDNITITNSCGESIFVPQIRICPFKLGASSFIPISVANCQNGVLTNFAIGDMNCNATLYPKFPLTVTIRDIPANNVVEIKTYHSPFDYSFASTAMAQGTTYNVTMVDSCNNSSTTAVTTPVLNRYVSLGHNVSQAMLDSTLITTLAAVGFPTQGTTLTITGGPVSAHSTKPGYEYNENYVYPKTFTGQLSSDSSTVFSMANTAPGIYTYVIKDSCGNLFPGSFEILTTDVASFHYKYEYQKGCAGSSGLQYEVVQNSFSEVNITDIATGATVHTTYGWQMNQNPYINVVNNITASDYEFKIYYYGRGAALSMNNILVDTFIVRDTIHITPYQNPALKTSASTLCNGDLYLILTADSSKGIAPYQYEIISGPQTFPPQASNLFTLTQSGNYTIRLIDGCGNSVSTNVTVDPLVFPPIAALGSICANDNAQLTYGASAYFAYTWIKPNGSTYTGDTLFINPVSFADTGVYIIKRIATINGCSNTDSTTYRLYLGKQDSTTVAICLGQTFLFGNNILSVGGIYKDTIPTATCDSISILNLIVSDVKRDSSSVVICRGQSYAFGSQLLTVAGIYRDTIPTAFCDSIAVLNLIVNDVKKDSISAAICRGQSYSFGNQLLTVAGIYRDTISTALCDSIAVLNLIINEVKRDSISAAICRGQSYTFGNQLLTAAGIYRDTTSTAFCDSITVLNLSVYELPLVKVQSDKYIVGPGETVHLIANPPNLSSYLWVSLNALNTAGIYNPSSIVNIPSWYKVTVRDTNNCSQTDSLYITLRTDPIISCDKANIISIPAAFTPNNDGRNDQFKILGINNIPYKKFSLSIYNRWGQLIFKSETPAHSWDGSYKGAPANIGNYAYHFEFICSDGKTAFNKKGNILLLR